MQQPYTPQYESGNRDTVGSGGTIRGFCGLYHEVPVHPFRVPEVPDEPLEVLED